jgi:2-isopropylmalate synthase
VREIAGAVRGPSIVAVARATDRDVESAARSLTPAARKRIQVVIRTSDIELDRSAGMSPRECIDRAVRAVRRASEHADEVEFSAENATRTDIHFLVTMFQEAARAGARRINIPDTEGCARPAEFANLVLAVRGALVAYNGGLRVSVSCHDALGLAVANTLSAIDAGAQQVHVGLSTHTARGDDASLEEVVTALRARRDQNGAETSVRAENIATAVRLYAEVTGAAQADPARGPRREAVA